MIIEVSYLSHIIDRSTDKNKIRLLLKQNKHEKLNEYKTVKKHAQ